MLLEFKARDIFNTTELQTKANAIDYLKSSFQEIEELKTLLNIPQSYKNGNLIRLIKSIKKELKEKTDLSFNFEAIKESRQFKSFEFTIQYNKKENKLSVKDKQKLTPSPIETQSLRSSLKTMRVSDNDQ
ncbi:hypothetical protein CRU94_08025 [Arcobacter sp. AHV-9/2010]|uniref:replication initiation protein n=1 Tax=Arcobacter sp. AHV-9/2010 TaxID=2021861 RepID=UPI00100BBC5D|nr:replication initiation protein [Arcobacter sp. CECT 9299]RXJ94706.1 hypothetical protein CRU94_08025 [Arcobacter sp. CECT 9299]